MLHLLVSSRAVLASGVLHAGLAVGLAASGGGHADAALGDERIVLLEIESSIEEVDAPVLEPLDPRETAHAGPRRTPTRALPHVHPYPVAAHGAYAHDASIPHQTSHGAAADDGAAPDAVLPEVTPPVPTFTLARGGGASGGPIRAGTTRVAPKSAGGGGAPTDGGGGPEAATYGAGDVSVPAKVVATAQAIYPEHARHSGLEADVVVEIVVDRAGRVADARVVRASDPEMDRAALAAIRRYRFSPAARDGHAVRVRMPWVVQFRLR